MREKEQTDDVENQTNQIVKLKDGRNLGYAEYGNLKGKVVFYFHGSPSSRLEAAALHETATRLNVYIISVDRPGMGLSTFQNGRRILDFVDDVAELADALNIDRFAVMGMSGGGTYAYACACKMPDRITGASIISGIGPIDELNATRNMIISTRLTLWLSVKAPYLMRLLFAIILNDVRRKHNLYFYKSLPHPDQATLSIPFIADMWIESILEAFRSGTIGPVWDLGLFKQPWGFNPEEIIVPVQLWHGELDRNVPSVIARRLAVRIPKCQAKFYSHEGHFSLGFNHIEEIIATLVSQSYHVPLKREKFYKQIASLK
jgi:pimeloyl-ACP methyl ester carboxylesterase